MPHFFLFGLQVSKGVRRWRGFARNLDDDLDAGINQRAGFVAIIREKPDSTEAQVVQDRGRHTEIAAISHEPQCMICFNRIQTAVLQRVSLQLRRQADATALLMFVDQQPAAFLSNGLHGHLQLVPTVTPQRPEHLAREALRMDAHQRNARRHIAQNKRQRGLNRWTPLSISRSNPNARNIPHLVGIRVEATRRTVPIWVVAFILVLRGSAISYAATAAGLDVGEVGFPMTPPARRRSISFASKPSSWRICSLCSPIFGAPFAGTLVTPCT